MCSSLTLLIYLLLISMNLSRMWRGNDNVDAVRTKCSEKKRKVEHPWNQGLLEEQLSISLKTTTKKMLVQIIMNMLL